MRQHTQAVKARIEEIPALAAKTKLGIALKDAAGNLPKPPLALIHPADGTDTQTRYTGPRSTQHPRFTLHLVGSSVDNVQTITEQVKAKFVVDGFGVAPAVSGERTFNLTWSSDQPIQWDTDVSPAVPYQIVEIEFDAEPA